jgi:hypothetical protein
MIGERIDDAGVQLGEDVALRREAKGSGLQELLQYSLVILAEAVTSLIELDVAARGAKSAASTSIV